MPSYSDEFPLHQAAAAGDASRIRELLDAGFKVNARFTQNETPLMAASRLGRLEAVQVLVEAKANVNAKDRVRQSALHRAVEVGHYRITKALLEAGAEVDSIGKRGYTPLVHACEAGNPELVLLLLNHGADPNGRDSRYATPLTAVILMSFHALSQKLHRPQEPFLEIVRELLRAGADTNLQGGGEAPLHGVWSAELASILLTAGVDINARDCQGRTPLNGVAMAGPLQLIRCFVEEGADVNIPATDGSTVLERIFDRRPPEMETLEMLVNAGGNIHAVDQWGRSLLDNYVWSYGREEESVKHENPALAAKFDLRHYLPERAAYIQFLKDHGAISELERGEAQSPAGKRNKDRTGMTSGPPSLLGKRGSRFGSER